MRDLDWQIIVKLFKEKNMTRTADLVYMTQPTLSKHIQQIEEELGTMLVNRTPRGVIFTSEGEYIARKAEEILGLFENVKQYLAFTSGGKRGVLNIGAPNSFSRLVLPRLMKRFTEICPDIRFDISTATSNVVLEMVERREVQLGFVCGSYSSTLDTILFSTEQTYAVTKQPVELADLPRIPRIEFPNEPTILRAIEKWWYERFDAPPMTVMRVNHADICRAMVLEGLGYGIFPHIGYFSEADKLATIPLGYKDGSKLMRDTNLFYHREDTQNPLINGFVQFIQTQAIKSTASSKRSG
jgi:DNA-binding transcriptional LysR family regulator